MGLFCHLMDDVKKALKLYEKVTSIIPGGCTKFTKTPNVFWNTKAPTRQIAVYWILHSWKELDEEIIVKPFKACVLNLNADGSKDESIHCFKKDQPSEGYTSCKLT